jgi:3-hydroxybutyryl-CoA dehydrogenase
MHFFNPATVLPLVEVIPCELTSDETVQRVRVRPSRLGKTIITAKDRAGFVVNARC